jgi:hypothetical protein
MKDQQLQQVAKALIDAEDYKTHLFQYYIERYKGHPPQINEVVSNFLDDLSQSLTLVYQAYEGKGGEKNVEKGKQSQEGGV